MRGRLSFVGVLILISISLNAKNSPDKYLIGFSQCISSDSWRQTMQLEMLNEKVLYPEFELIIKDAHGSNEQQIKDVEDLLVSGIDLLIISPNESKPLTPIVQKVFQKGIPVIIIDRNIEANDYTAFIGADNFEIGVAAGKYAVNLLKGKGEIIEIWGLKGSSPAIERHRGFVQEISKYPEIEIVFSESGEWEEEGGKMVMQKAIDQHLKFDLVFAHNDYMAKGAWEVKDQNHLTYPIAFMGIDGLPGQNEGVQQVIDKKLRATFLYPTGGDKAIDLAWKILNKQPFEKEMILQTVVIDSTNATVIKMQTDQILVLQEKIQKFKDIIDEQLIKYKGQRTFLILSLVFLFIVVALTFLVFTAYKSKNIIYKKLEKHQDEIQKQNNELVQMSQKLEEATQEKLRFFTNISHEFRTPLTLIIGPLEAILKNKSCNREERKTIERMNRNANRLLRMINQLMDLRKIENSKMSLQVANYDLMEFLCEIKDSFTDLAYAKNINFMLFPLKNNIELWFDYDKMDKVFFNLLSNAFKFTDENGTISVSVNEVLHNFDDNKLDAIEIEVRDSGKGMKEEFISKIFDHFYQIEQGTNYLGTGIGLTLTKSFIELHKGDINVKSEKDKGTSFYIYLRKGKAHFQDGDFATMIQVPKKMSYSDYVEYDAINKNTPGKEEQTLTKFDKKPLVLVVEDNADVRAYITESISDMYTVFEVNNGVEALKSIDKEEPDLVISDVMMPEMDGLELTKKIKNDLKTCHIPVILLTARVSTENKIEGLESGADSYIPKPFNSEHLKVRVRKLIEGRQKIKEYYRVNFIIDIPISEQISPLDKKFIQKINDAIEQHLSDNLFGVEELSDEIGMSRVHFYRKVKSLTDLTASEYLRNYKLKRAAVLLMQKEKSITEIAILTGFSSTSYFSKCFKDLYNMTPQHYSNQ